MPVPPHRFRTNIAARPPHGTRGDYYHSVAMPSFSSPKRTSDPAVGYGGLSGLPLEEQAPKRVRFGSNSSRASSVTSGEGGQDSPGTGTGDMALLEQQLGSKRFQIDFDWRDTFKQGPGDTPRADDEMRAFLAGTTLNVVGGPALGQGLIETPVAGEDTRSGSPVRRSTNFHAPQSPGGGSLFPAATDMGGQGVIGGQVTLTIAPAPTIARARTPIPTLT